MRMGGQMGNERVTVQNLQVIKVMPEHNLLSVSYTHLVYRHAGRRSRRAYLFKRGDSGIFA